MSALQKIFLCFAVILAVVYPALCQRSQRVVLYDQYDGKGNSKVLPEGAYVEDLSRIEFDNKIRSICATGIWLFYQDPNYNAAGARGMEYIFGRDNYCVNIRTVAGTISSLRYAGSPKDYAIDSLTLYANDYFQGQEEYTLNEARNINLAGNHKSVIITGNSHWTVYDRADFQGNHLCLRVPEPGNNTPSFISDLQNAHPPVPHGKIRSVRKGCIEGVSYTLSSFARMNGKNTFVPTKLA